MRYPSLPPVGKLSAPDLDWKPSNNHSSRNGRRIEVCFTHVWGGGDYDGVVSWLRTSSGADAVSAHVVYAGETGPHAGKAAQLVAWGDKAWTECDLNSLGISIESADAIWRMQDPDGFARLARMTALILHTNGLNTRWVRGDALLNGSATGHTRHADAGRLGCGHGYCPTTDLDLYEQFHERVVLEDRHGGFRKKYGRS